MIGLCIEEEPPSYDMDTEDEEWLNAQSRDRVSCSFFCDHNFTNGRYSHCRHSILKQ